MSKKHDWVSIAGGVALIVLAILPTPDDATIVSPVAQASAGIALIMAGWENGN